ncbi:hypothetical protein ACF9IK_01740 [Kitasatospora hibisci]|uniref:hypothetical protein n=1 Tax=Kitasatospora hibisci TaxID=3369522 RepID=UPI0037543CDB
MIDKEDAESRKNERAEVRRYLPSARVLARRAALGLAYAVGALPVTITLHWLTSRW